MCGTIWFILIHTVQFMSGVYSNFVTAVDISAVDVTAACTKSAEEICLPTPVTLFLAQILLTAHSTPCSWFQAVHIMAMSKRHVNRAVLLLMHWTSSLWYLLLQYMVLYT